MNVLAGQEVEEPVCRSLPEQLCEVSNREIREYSDRKIRERSDGKIREYFREKCPNNPANIGLSFNVSGRGLFGLSPLSLFFIMLLVVLCVALVLAVTFVSEY